MSVNKTYHTIYWIVVYLVDFDSIIHLSNNPDLLSLLFTVSTKSFRTKFFSVFQCLCTCVET